MQLNWLQLKQQQWRQIYPILSQPGHYHQLSLSPSAGTVVTLSHGLPSPIWHAQPMAYSENMYTSSVDLTILICLLLTAIILLIGLAFGQLKTLLRRSFGIKKEKKNSYVSSTATSALSWLS